MKKLYHFPPMAVLALFVSIFVILMQACIFVNSTLLDPKIYNEAMNAKNVTDSIYNELCTYFKSLSNATGIPVEVYTDPLDKEELYTASYKLLQESLNYLTDETAPKPSVNYDFSKIEKSITDYVNKHAEEHGIEKDKEYDKLLNNTIKTAKTQIESRFDVMMLYQFSGTSAAESVHKYSKLIGIGVFVFAGIALLLLVGMAIVDRRHPRDYPYWLGLILTVTSGFYLIPTIYLKATNYFDAFFIRNEYIYKTVTGMFEISLNRIFKLQLILLIVGIVLIISTQVIHFVYLHHLKKEYHKTHGND